MLPVLFKLGPLPVYAWGFTLSIAILIGAFLAIRLARNVNMDSNQVLDLILVLIAGGVAGARLFYVFVYEPQYFLHNPLEVFALWHGGMVYYGALIGGFITGTWYIIKKNMPFWRLADVVSPSLALGYGIVRIGCFMNGCCYGRPTDSFLGVVFPYIEGAPCPELVARYPTQLFSSAFGFLLFVFLMFLWKKRKFDGQLFLTFMIIYPIGRSVIEGFRENLIVFYNVTVAQLVSVLIIIPAAVIYAVKYKASQKG